MTDKKKFGLLSSLDGSGAPKSHKKKFQVFEGEIGFEKFEVVIPFDKAEAFESAAKAAKPKTLTRLKQLIKDFEGHLSK